MKKSGNPASPYHFFGRMEETLARVVTAEKSRIQKVVSFSFLAGLILWGLDWLLQLVAPSVAISFSQWDLLLFVAMAYGFVYRKERMGIAFAGIFWFNRFLVALRIAAQGFASGSARAGSKDMASLIQGVVKGLGGSVASGDLSAILRGMTQGASATPATGAWYAVIFKVLILLFVLYVLSCLFEPLTFRRQKHYHLIKPVIKLILLLGLVISLVVGLIVFFGGIRQNWLHLSELIYLLGSTFMLLLCSMEFEREKGVQQLKRLVPCCFAALLLLFGLIEGLANGLKFWKTAVSVAPLFYGPLVRNIFAILFILPVYFLLAWQFRYPERAKGPHGRSRLPEVLQEGEEGAVYAPTAPAYAPEAAAAAGMTAEQVWTDANAYAQAAPYGEATPYTEAASYSEAASAAGAAVQAPADNPYAAPYTEAYPEAYPESYAQAYAPEAGDYNPLQQPAQPHEAWEPLPGYRPEGAEGQAPAPQTGAAPEEGNGARPHRVEP